MFGNRLRRNARHLAKWARREQVSCYRLYDSDIPEIPLVVDRYGIVTGGIASTPRLVISDMRRYDDELAREGWLDAMVETASAILEVPAEHIFVKRRERMAGRQDGRQYERQGDDGAWHLVDEAGRKFWVNLSDYLDTGLFLDHRMTRLAAANDAVGGRLLNLFCYTGSFTVHAAGAGARASTSVDLSNTYIDWSRRNWRANNMDEGDHELVQGDVREFLVDSAAHHERYQVAVVDPPTFSNSKRMDYTFDIQRDHGALLADVANLIVPGGIIWFSTNRQRFRLDEEMLPAGCVVEDRTRATIPPDFRDAHAHRAWRIVVP